MKLTQKENTLLQDLKKQEKLCVEKYENYAADACAPGLKKMFTKIGQTEQQHYDTVQQILNGEMPQVNTSGKKSGGTPAAQQPVAKYSAAEKKADKYLCEDALGTEKYVSSVYGTSIFEFKDPQLRVILNHIQTEEQQHGETIYSYMEENKLVN